MPQLLLELATHPQRARELIGGEQRCDDVALERQPGARHHALTQGRATHGQRRRLAGGSGRPGSGCRGDDKRQGLPAVLVGGATLQCRDPIGEAGCEPDIEHADAEGLPWIEDHPFVRDAVALKAQLASLEAKGGGDEPESLLDALYTIATMEATPKGAQSEEPTRWRYRSEAARVLHAFLGSLDDDKRAVFVLAELEQMTAPEIAQALAVNVITVYSRLRTARIAFEQAVFQLRSSSEREHG